MTYGPKPTPPYERLVRGMTIDDNGCWLPALKPATTGYSVVGEGRKRILRGHRVSYEHHVGPIPEGFDLDHLCRVRRCINPAHLEPITHAENVRRGNSPGAMAIRENRCRRGHPLDDAPVYSNGKSTGRYCQACAALRKKRRREKAAIALVGLALAVVPQGSAEARGQRGCGKYHGREFVICKESGLENMPNGLPPGAPHPGASSASGPCGFLKATRIQYGGDDLDACTAYMEARYGSWAKAERFHRMRNWW